jgi:hypothetical protein
MYCMVVNFYIVQKNQDAWNVMDSTSTYMYLHCYEQNLYAGMRRDTEYVMVVLLLDYCCCCFTAGTLTPRLPLLYYCVCCSSSYYCFCCSSTQLLGYRNFTTASVALLW